MLYTCPRCYYTFSSAEQPAACPECGHARPVPASSIEYDQPYWSRLNALRERALVGMSRDERNWTAVLMFLSHPKATFYTASFLKSHVLEATAEICLDTYKSLRWDFIRRVKEDEAELASAGIQTPEVLMRDIDGNPLIPHWNRYGLALQTLYGFELEDAHAVPNLGSIKAINLDRITTQPGDAYIAFLRNWLALTGDVCASIDMPEVPIVQKIIGFDLSTGRIEREVRPLQWIDEAALPKAVEANVVGLYPDYTFQKVEGWGCAMTEASCYLLSSMTPERRREALSRWFGPDGINARFIRMHIDSCDYALTEYQSVADPIADPELETFNIDRDRQWTIPVVKEALAMAGGQLRVLLSPWSPPWQWKTPPEFSQNDAAVYGGGTFEIDTTKPGRSFGGRLKPEYYGPWARYLVKFIQAYLDEGIPVSMLSIQNESSAATSWDSCLWSGDQERLFLKEYLYPEMERAGLAGKIEIFIWDHNKERAIEHIDAFMADPDAAEKISGFAYHWYSGDHFEALELLGKRYPKQVLMHSESCPLHIPGRAVSMSPTEDGVLNRSGDGVEKSPAQCDFEDAVAYAHDIIGDLNHGMQRWIDWNMIVDKNGGPRRVPGGFAAPLVLGNDGEVIETVAYAFISAIADVIRPDATRIGKSVFGRDVEVAACKNADGAIGVVLLNRSESETAVNLRMSGKIIQGIELPAGTLTTLEIRKQYE